MVFYQAVLLAGYATAHASVAWLGSASRGGGASRRLAPAARVLPIAGAGGWTPPTETNPALWLLG